MKTTLSFIGGAAFGAAVTYVADPRLGKRRRALARDAGVHLARIVGRAVAISVQDSKNRVMGMFKESKKLARQEPVDDAVLEDRVRTAVGRVSSHPNVEVIVERGRVTLLGPVVEGEQRLVLKAAKSVPGVVAVTNRMKPYTPGAFMPTQHAKPEQPFDIMQSHWAPATRLAVGAVAGSLIVTGGMANRHWSALPRAAGLALLVRAATNMEFKRLLGFRVGPRAVAIQKTIKIHAPVERVYSLFTDYRNFPVFMSRIHEVRDLGDGRSHWIVRGPLGATLEWDAKITEMTPNKLLEWRSEPGSLIQHAGMVRFDDESGHTRVHIRLSYNPPAGAIGHAVATLLGSSPKQEMDADLVRMKTFIETGKRPHDARHIAGQSPACSA